MTFLAYLIDRIFGEFSLIRHPVIVMGDHIQWFEKRFYKDSIFRGFLLTLTLLLMVWAIIGLISSTINLLPHPIATIVTATIASTTIASKMLYDSVKEIITDPQKIKYLVSRDTQHLSHSDINKSAIESYAENLSDGVIAPLFYLLLFGLDGAFLYKAINTLDSMVGYRTSRYEKFGKFSAKLDDLVNYLPARLTALLIALLMGSRKALVHFYLFGKEHESPNAGHPISAMALAIGVKLGGDTVYFGVLKPKAFFGEGREKITVQDILKGLRFRHRLDRLVVSLMLLWGVIYHI